MCASVYRRARDKRNKTATTKDRTHECIIKLSPVVVHSACWTHQETPKAVWSRHVVVAPGELNERILLLAIKERHVHRLRSVVVR